MKHDAWLTEQLHDDAFAAAYLTQAAQDLEPAVFAQASRTVADEYPKDFYVYLHRKATTGEVFYVGKGNRERAWRRTSRSRHWQNIVRKHGLIVEIAADGLQEWYAHELECDLIALHGRLDLGYGSLCNMTDGGDGMNNPSEDTRKKMSESQKQNYQNPDFKKKNTEHLRRLHSDPIWKEKCMQALQRGRGNGRAKPIMCIETGQIFKSASYAMEWIKETQGRGSNQSCLSAAARRIVPSAYGYTWRYVDQ